MDGLLGVADATKGVSTTALNGPMTCGPLPAGFEQVFASNLKIDLQIHSVLHSACGQNGMTLVSKPHY